MFNVTVLRMKDLFKYFIGIVLIILIIVVIGKDFNKTTKETNVIENIKKGVSSLIENNLIPCMEQTIPAIGDINKEYKKQAKENAETNDEQNIENNILHSILNTQISSIKGMKEGEKVDVETAKTEENANKTNENGEADKNQEETKVAEAGTKTEVITNNPITESYNVTYNNVKIKNQTDYVLTEDMLKPDIQIENKNIILFHTHSCESYTSSEKYPYTPTGNFRTTDLNFTVTRVGTELENELKKYNYNVVHNTDYHDYPAYNGSYTKSLATVENILKTTPSDIIIDIHRDAIGSRSDYAPTVKIGDTDEAAQLMFVIRNKQWRIMASELESKLKICYKNTRKSRRNVSRIIQTNDAYKIQI